MDEQIEREDMMNDIGLFGFIYLRITRVGKYPRYGRLTR